MNKNFDRCLGWSAVLLLAVLVAPGLGQEAYRVSIKSADGIGQYLVDARGMTLYEFRRDSHLKSACTGECSALLPPFYDENLTVSPGLRASDFGTIIRDDGKKQVTYKGKPLYYFADDRKPGDANGDGVYHLCYPAKPSDDLE